MFALFYLLAKKLDGFDLKQMGVPFIKMSYAATLMGISIYIPLKLLDRFVFDSTQLLLITVITSLVGISAYLLFTKILNVEEVELLKKLIQRINLKRTMKKPEALKGVTEIKY